MIDPPGAATAVDSDPFAGVLAGVAEQLGAVVDVPMFGLDDTRLQARLGGVLAVRARVEELVARLVKEVDDRGLPARAGASSTRARLQATHRMSRNRAAAITAQARSVSDGTEPGRRAHQR